MPSDLSRPDNSEYFRAIFDAIPLPTFIVDADVRIQDYNAAGSQLLGPEPELALYHRGGEALNCIHAEAKGCGQSERCQACVIRSSVRRALDGGITHRQTYKAELRSSGGKRVIRA